MGNAESNNNNNNHEEDISLPEIPRENGIFSFGDEDLFHQESTESEYNFSGALDRRYSFESAESPNFFNF